MGDLVELRRDEYEYLVDRDNMLKALERYGVDNWLLYDRAMQDYRNNKDDGIYGSD